VHYIQSKILIKLLYADTLRYTEMRPERVESNHFAYHLAQLIHDGFIAKQDKTYTLSPKGLSYVDRMSQNKMVNRLQPHIVTAIDVTNNQGETLLFKRAFQPYIHTLSFPLGKTHYDETIMQAAERELEEKTGLDNVPLTHRGAVYIHSKKDGETVSKILCHVLSGTTEERISSKVNHRGSTLWAKVSDYAPQDFMPGFLRTKALLQRGTDFFFDEITEDI
jgi:8-oxo-dGTP pyrophosphatase MutT (NUDIX family)